MRQVGPRATFDAVLGVPYFSRPPQPTAGALSYQSITNYQEQSAGDLRSRRYPLGTIESVRAVSVCSVRHPRLRVRGTSAR